MTVPRGPAPGLSQVISGAAARPSPLFFLASMGFLRSFQVPSFTARVLLCISVLLAFPLIFLRVVANLCFPFNTQSPGIHSMTSLPVFLDCFSLFFLS